MNCGPEGCQMELEFYGFKLIKDGAVYPKVGTKSSAGHDMFVPTTSDAVTIRPNETRLVDLGVAAFMPENSFLDLRIRSSLALKGLIFMNSCGVIDADYFPNSIGIIVHNLSDKDIVLSPGMKVAQGIFLKYQRDSSVTIEDNTTVRTGGFGSTGIGV